MQIIKWIREDFHFKHDSLYDSQLQLMVFETVFLMCDLSAQTEVYMMEVCVYISLWHSWSLQLALGVHF